MDKMGNEKRDFFTPNSPEPILRFFKLDYLEEPLRSVSDRFHVLAHLLVGELPRCAERTVALRKLLEAKDAALRAMLPEE